VGRGPGIRDWRAALANLLTGASTPLAVALNPSPGYQLMVWSPDGRWLFVVASGGRLLAVNALTGKATGLGIPPPAISQVAIRTAAGPAATP
jgi:hypothetical protein